MTENYFDFFMPVTLRAASTEPASDEIYLELRPAAEPIAAGEAGKQIGDINFQTIDGKQTAVVSLGKTGNWKAETFRKAGGAAARWLLKFGVTLVSLSADQFAAFQLEPALEAFLEGLRLGSFKFERRKQEKSEAAEIVVHVRGGQDASALETLIQRVTTVTWAVALTRDWGHEPANVINPTTLAERALALAERFDLTCKIIDAQELAKMGAGAITAVGQGSKTPSVMIVLEYSGSKSPGSTQPIALVGKAITFDTGGYSLKSVESIRTMKYDKMGGITVLAAMAAAAELRLPIQLVGVVCAAENMISAQAYRPDDILTSLSGKTIEILTTDAEGRLVLADGLTYVQRQYKPIEIIDLATLTGGVVTALGRVRAGLFSNNDALTQRLMQAGEATRELLWPLPLDEEYFANVRGDDADLKNSGGKEGHPIMGGIFLKQFIENDTPWAHLDIAGTADSDKELPYCPKGATGFGVRLLVEYLRSKAAA